MLVEHELKSPTPRFCEDRVDYFREEKEGYISIRATTHLEVPEMILNETAKEIIMICNGARTLDDIVNEMLGIYPTVRKEIIERDVMALLQTLSRLRLLEWDMPNPFHNFFEAQLGEGFVACVCCEDNTEEIIDFLELVNNDEQSKFIKYKNPLLNSGDISEVGIRQKMFSGMDYYFLLKQKDDIQGLIIIRKPFIYSNTLCTGQLYYIKKECPVILEFYKYAVGLLPLVVQDTITGFRFYREESDIENEKDINKMFDELEIVTEFVLRNELGYGKHLRVYRIPIDRN